MRLKNCGLRGCCNQKRRYCLPSLFLEDFFLRFWLTFEIFPIEI